LLERNVNLEELLKATPYQFSLSVRVTTAGRASCIGAGVAMFDAANSDCTASAISADEACVLSASPKSANSTAQWTMKSLAEPRRDVCSPVKPESF
jgi:hypothetical protein